jgi:hypothetical protein
MFLFLDMIYFLHCSIVKKLLPVVKNQNTVTIQDGVKNVYIYHSLFSNMICYMGKLILFYFTISKNENILFSGCSIVKFWNCLKKIIFQIKLFRHFEFSRKSFSIKVSFLPKILEKQKKNTQTHHFWKYWVININIFDAILNSDGILIFQDWQQISNNRTMQIV